jgi:hypothetical protein
VEDLHSGSEDNSVMYIPVGPNCALNRVYVNRIRFHFERGVTPPDFTNFSEKEPRDEGIFKI